MAEKILSQAISTMGEPYNNLSVISAGVSAMDGESASINSVEALKLINLELQDHRSRRLTQSMINEAFMILAMTSVHIETIRSHFHNLPKHLYLFGSFLVLRKNRDITDPYSMDLSNYIACRDTISETIPSIVQFIKQQYRTSV